MDRGLKNLIKNFNKDVHTNSPFSNYNYNYKTVQLVSYADLSVMGLGWLSVVWFVHFGWYTWGICLIIRLVSHWP